MADDDRDTDVERARLERVAWGSTSTPAEAARARIALSDLDHGRARVPRGAAEAVTDGPASQPEPVHGAVPPPAPATTLAPAPTSASTLAPAAAQGDAPATVEPSTDRLPDAQPGDPAAPGLPTGAAHPTGPAHDASPSGSRWTRVRDRGLRIVRSARARPWVAGGAAAAVVVAFGTGLVVGTVHPALPASPAASATPGTVTLQQLLDAPQTYADQLPGSLEAPVRLHSTRLVFTNRSLSGDDAATPWNVWAGVGADRSTVCLVATANRMEASTACFPRDDALHGKVSMTAQSLSGTLTVELSGGGVEGRVAQAF